MSLKKIPDPKLLEILEQFMIDTFDEKKQFGKSESVGKKLILPGNLIELFRFSKLKVVTFLLFNSVVFPSF